MAVGTGAARVLVAAAAVAIVLTVPTNSSPLPQHRSEGSAHVRRTSAPASTSTTQASTTTTSSTTTTTTTDPGSLPQTDQLPGADTPQFTAEVQALWQGVVSGSVTPALPSFFPRAAYVQLKTGIADPAGDWQNRLVEDFGLDLQAAHALLGSDPIAASFQGVSVPEQYAHWIPPGVCSNGIGYYEVANARVVYSIDGQTRSFGIASLISWRGTWYVVHLGAILRAAAAGTVDDPEQGPGTSAPSRTC